MLSIGLRLGRLLVHPADHNPPLMHQRIVIIKTGALGDVIMTTPLVQAIRTAWPQAEITYVVGRWSSEALKNNPAIDHLEVVDDTIFFRRRWIDLWRLASRLRRRKFDLGFILDRHFTAGLFGLASGISYRIGFDRYGEGFAHHRSVDVSSPRYDGEYYLDLLRALGYQATWDEMRLFPSKSDVVAAEKLWRSAGLTDRPTIGLAVGGGQNPGQTMVKKRWPATHYTRLITILRQKYPKVDIALFGGRLDQAINNDIIKASPLAVYNLAGSTILQSNVLMSRCRLFITHDSGPMHLAAASGTPVIAIFGPTDPRRLAPRGERNWVLSRPDLPGALCYTLWGEMPTNLPDPLPCLEAIQAEDVMETIEQHYRQFLSDETIG